MKHEKWITPALNGLLAFCVAIGSVSCLLTGFSLDNLSMEPVLWITALVAAVFALAFSVRHGWKPLIGALALTLLLLWWEGTVLVQLETLVQEITEIYDMGYGWGKLWWTDPDLLGMDITWAAVFLSCAICALVSLVLHGGLPGVFAVIPGFVPLAACCVVTDTVPQEGPMVLLLCAQVLVLLTQGIRRRSRKEATRLVALLLVPVLLAGNLLFYAAPREGYEIAAGSLQQTVLSWFNTLPFVSHTPTGDLTVNFGNATASERINLANVGPKVKLTYGIVDVLSEESGMLYLRGQAFEEYDGKNWYTVHYEDLQDAYWPSKGMLPGGKVTLSFRGTHQQLYFPYYPDEESWFLDLQDGKLDNEDNIREYTWTVMKPGQAAGYVLPDGYDGSDIRQQCLSLPETTLEQLQPILEQLMPFHKHFSQQDKVELIREYVSSIAAYDLNTPRMSEDYEDFALWFLEESNTGYCIHFATAATVLLRAAGIPARYVTGYAMEVQAGTKNTVTADKAHAWVEYLDSSRGWTVLEVTPEEDETDPPETTVPTQPPETTLPTKPPPTENTDPVTRPTPGPSTPPTEDPTETTLPGEETQQSTATTPSGGIGILPGNGTAGGRASWLMPVLLVSIGLVLICFLLWLQQLLRRLFRQKQMERGHPNRRGLYAWRHTVLLSKLLKQMPPKELQQLAEKAAFSQHTLTEEELKQFRIWFEDARLQLKKHPLPIRLWIGLVYGIKL